MKIRLLHSGAGDWVGLYIDGELITEGHSIDELSMINMLLPNADAKSVWGSEYLEEYGNHCPKNFPIELEPENNGK